MNPNKVIDLDYRRLVRAGKKLALEPGAPSVRLALLSDAATQQFVPVLKALFAEHGVAAECYEGAFDALELEVLDAGSGLHAFQPDVVVLLCATQALRARYYARGCEGELERLTRLWDALVARGVGRIIQANFALPFDRPFGQYDLKGAPSLYASVQKLNAALATAAAQRASVLICDLESVASYVGRRHWFDERLWDLSKTFCNLEHLPRAAQAIADLVLASLGRVVKCVVLDLDNTLWGGVVGDAGATGVEIGAHGDGEAFHRFQHFLLALKNRGILLAVCSKNELANALAPFEQHPDMVLRREDITVFVANWENKADNLRTIRDTLEIGFDSLVFLDDNPFERNLVRTYLPEVIVPELPDDPADWVRALTELDLFETTSFSSEDLARAALYKQEADRREARAAFTDVSEYLRSLDMRIGIEPFRRERLARISQLFLRSNQFNLTTQRHSEAQCAALMDDPDVIALTASLEDRFGDHGLISIVVARPDGHVLKVSDWLMSCRVLGRGVEQYLMNRLFALARERGLAAVEGEYRPTSKNGLVKEFWSGFGFASEDGRHYRLETSRYQKRDTFIREIAGPALEVSP
ncbi:MAG TPA: HAD-IIIC family phosphatase [Steroidobacteraceae bacterium]|nr:HAD-IIIC family phosphatase [Steroidobacteraceae bacterium]